MNTMNPMNNTMNLMMGMTQMMAMMLQAQMGGQQMQQSPFPMGPGAPGMGDAFAGSPEMCGCQSPAGMGGGIPNFGQSFGGGSPGVGSSPMGGASPMGGSPGGGNSGSKAVDIARQFNGQSSQSLKGKLPGFTAPGGKTNNCAAFVSACLENAGSIPKGGGSASVKTLRSKLQKLGWRKVPAQQARPGDVWMTRPGQGSHTELVSTPGGGKTIGSNNNGQKGFQRISERGKSANSGEIWQK